MLSPTVVPSKSALLDPHPLTLKTAISETSDNLILASYMIKMVIRLVFLLPIEQYSTECPKQRKIKTKTNVITPANHNAPKQRNEPIRIESNVASVKLGETICMQVLTLSFSLVVIVVPVFLVNHRRSN